MAKIRKPQDAPHTEGSVAIEYGLILPAMLLFTLGIMDAGRLLWSYITLTRATEAAARCGAVDQTNCPTLGGTQTYATAQAWGLNDIATAGTFTATTQSCGVQVVGTYAFQFVIPWFYGTAPFGAANQLALSATACYPKQY